MSAFLFLTVSIECGMERMITTHVDALGLGKRHQNDDRPSTFDLESELQAEGENSLQFNGSFEGENSLYEPSPPSSPKAHEAASDQRALKLSEHKGKVPPIARRVLCLCACSRTRRVHWIHFPSFLATSVVGIHETKKWHHEDEAAFGGTPA
jgi:hypothetical protein